MTKNHTFFVLRAHKVRFFFDFILEGPQRGHRGLFKIFALVVLNWRVWQAVVFDEIWSLLSIICYGIEFINASKKYSVEMPFSS